MHCETLAFPGVSWQVSRRSFTDNGPPVRLPVDGYPVPHAFVRINFVEANDLEAQAVPINWRRSGGVNGS
jgi:hypothetical protein